MTHGYMTDPQGIEKKSMQIIAPYLAPMRLTAEQTKVYERIIHATGDPDYVHHVVASPAAITAGVEALRKGRDIYTDVHMARVGINAGKMARCGGRLFCQIDSETVRDEAKSLGITRAMVAMRKFGRSMDGQIIAIGNAPTALWEVLSLMEGEGLRPALIIGVPVGFVGAAESKEALLARSPVPLITVRGHKGGSTVAAAICNALLNVIKTGNGE